MFGSQRVTEDGAEPKTSRFSLADLLAAGQFDVIEQRLQELEAHSSHQSDSGFAILVTTANHLTLMYQQLTRALHYHNRALEQSSEQQQSLQRQLHSALLLIEHHQTAVSPLITPTAQPPPTTMQPSFWQRVKAVLSGTELPLREQEDQKTAVSLPKPQVVVMPEIPPPEIIDTPFSEPPKSSDQPVPEITHMPATAVDDVPATVATTAAIEAEAAPITHPSTTESKEPALTIYCLGTFRVFQQQQAISEWNGQKGVAILKYLVAHHGKSISKEILMDTFWPDADLEAARRNLHQAVYALRQTLRREQPDLQHIRYENDSYRLNPDLEIWIDYEEFEEHVKNGRYLEANSQPKEAIAEYGVAEGLYQGNFLEDSLYDEWTLRPREYLLNQYLRISDRLIAYYQRQNENTAAIALCHKLLNFDACYEPAHRQLMTCFLAQGQRHMAVRQYQTCAQSLSTELGLEPDEETDALYQNII